MSSNTLKEQFFKELKKYNVTNFKTLLRADLTVDSPEIHKSCSSVVTRYFIFAEKHPEVSKTDLNMLYFQLRIDTIARYFAEYPASNLSDLQPFQDELRRFVEKAKEHEGGENNTSISDI